MSQDLSRVVSAEVKEEYMALQGIQTYCSQLTSQNSKTVKSHLSLTLMQVKLVPAAIANSPSHESNLFLGFARCKLLVFALGRFILG